MVELDDVIDLEELEYCKFVVVMKLKELYLVSWDLKNYLILLDKLEVNVEF